MVFSAHLAASAVLFRYVSAREHAWIKASEVILSLRGETFLSPDWYATAADAQASLALPFAPTHRIGPVAGQEVTFDGVSLRRVRSQFGQPGGGWEVSTLQAISYGVTKRFP